MIIVTSQLKHARKFAMSTKVWDPNVPGSPSATESMIGIWIKPGANIFQSEAEERWLKIRNDKANKEAVDKLIDEDVFREVLPKGKPGDVKGKKGKKGEEPKQGSPESVADLKEFDSRMAIDIVRGTADADLLETYLEQENRSNVLAAIREQIKIVKTIDKERKSARDLMEAS